MTEHQQSAETANFDFISDQKFKASLVSDYRDILRCLESQAWKAVHVLAGSVVEAILIDYLVTTDYDKRKGADPLRMDLAAAIAACKTEGVLSDKAADLSTVVRSYRNLIHPGRVIRLGEKVNQQTATIAKALLDVIIEEITEARTTHYGFTAEQIANKMQSDPASLHLLHHFLKDTSEHERERLLTDVLPKRYFEVVAFGMPDINHDNYASCFRRTFDSLPHERKSRIASRFPKMLREEGQHAIRQYEQVFFLGRDMEFLNAKDRELVKEHLISHTETEPGVPSLSGLGGFLDAKEIRNVTGNYLRLFLRAKDGLERHDPEFATYRLFSETSSEGQMEMRQLLATRIENLKKRGSADEQAELLQDVDDFLDGVDPSVPMP